jgi:predicted ATPase
MKARQLCQQTGNMTHLYLILGDLSTYHYVQAEHQIARELAEEALQLSQQTGNPLDDALGHWYLGFISFALGEFASAKINLEYLVNFYRPEHHQEMIALRGSDMGLSAVAYYAGCLWCLGYPDQAEKKSQEALALAQEFNNAITSVEILCYAGCMFNSLSRNWQAVTKYAEKMIELSNEKGFIGWIFTAMLYRGNALAMLGNIQEGIAKTQEALDTNEPICLRLYLPGILHFHALAHAMAGDLEEGLNTIEQALEIQKQTTEGLWEADIYRVKAQLLLEKGDAANAEECLLKAIETARRQEAKSWELRASIDLCRLWHSQGKNEEARQLLSNIYNWFTEGFETADLKEAKKLLAVLS